MKINPKILKFRKPIANRIKKIRLETGLTQNAFALRMGMSQPQYLRIERGDFFPSSSFFIAIHKHYGVSADYILFGN